MKSPSRIVLFSKIPGEAPVKTRLEELLSESERVRLAEAMLIDTVLAAQESSFSEIYLCSDPETNEEQLKVIAQKHGCSAQRILKKPCNFSPQSESLFSERLDDCFSAHFSSCSVAMIGSDCPMIAPSALSQAKGFLDRDISCIGPTPDGGLWLIGLSTTAQEKGLRASSIFGQDGLDISNFAQALEDKNLQFAVLPMLQDLDLPEDLASLKAWLAIEVKSQNRGEFYPEFSAKTLGSFTLQAKRFSDDTRKTRIVRS